jgi:hypothetical protein
MIGLLYMKWHLELADPAGRKQMAGSGDGNMRHVHRHVRTDVGTMSGHTTAGIFVTSS